MSPQESIEKILYLWKQISSLSYPKGQHAHFCLKSFSRDKFTPDQLREYYELLFLYLDAVSDFIVQIKYVDRYHLHLVKSAIKCIEETTDDVVREKRLYMIRRYRNRLYPILRYSKMWENVFNKSEIYHDYLKRVKKEMDKAKERGQIYVDVF